jgi:hypothetical protein
MQADLFNFLSNSFGLSGLGFSIFAGEVEVGSLLTPIVYKPTSTAITTKVFLECSMYQV